MSDDICWSLHFDSVAIMTWLAIFSYSTLFELFLKNKATQPESVNPKWLDLDLTQQISDVNNWYHNQPVGSTCNVLHTDMQKISVF